MDLPKTWREMTVQLAKLGAVAERTRGSHQTWKFHDGEAFVVVVNHLGDGIPKGFLSKFKRLLERRAGLPVVQAVATRHAGRRM